MYLTKKFRAFLFQFGNNGFNIFNLAGKPGTDGKLILETSLKNATPNAVYDIRLDRNQGSCDLLAHAITTNEQGNGNAHNVVPGSAGSSYQVVVQNRSNSKDAFISEPPETVN